MESFWTSGLHRQQKIIIYIIWKWFQPINDSILIKVQNTQFFTIIKFLEYHTIFANLLFCVNWPCLAILTKINSINNLYRRVCFFACKKSTKFLSSLLRCCKNITNIAILGILAMHVYDLVYRKFRCLCSCKKCLSFTSFTYFGYFGYAWSHSPKVIAASCGKLWWLSANQKLTCASIFSRDITLKRIL